MKNKSSHSKWGKAWLKKHRWYISYNRAEQRCNNPNCHQYCNYGGRGIKFLMTSEDFKKLWFRDKAYLMKRPSIDRIDNNGNYELNNCRYIELIKNIRRKRNIVGINRYNAKLTNFKVIQIRKKYSTSRFTQKELANKYGVSFQLISNIINHLKWKHI
jgi:hypothetical protein